MANPTTNYSFVLPTPTDLVTDLPADFDVALQGVDTRLKALQPGTTAGDLAYSSATANTNVRLGIGSNGQVLAVSGGVPAWTTTGAGGKVLQVVSATNATEISSSSATFADTGLTATITPTLNTSKILVIFSQTGCFKSNQNTTTRLGLKLLRGSTAIISNVTDIACFTNTILAIDIGSISASFLDTPATTLATTYKTQFNSVNATAQVILQDNFSTSTITLLEIGA